MSVWILSVSGLLVISYYVNHLVSKQPYLLTCHISSLLTPTHSQHNRLIPNYNFKMFNNGEISKSKRENSVQAGSQRGPVPLYEFEKPKVL